MNIPNSLTIARIFFVPLLVTVLVKERILLRFNGAVITNDLAALMIFWVAAATDLLDGYLARRWKQVTTIGTLLDPIADKLLVSAALIALVQERVVPAWLVVLLIGREFAFWGRKGFALPKGLQCFVKTGPGHKRKFNSGQIANWLEWLGDHPERGYIDEPAHWQFLERN